MCKVTVETPLIPTTKQSRLFWMKSSEQIFAPLDIQVNYTLFFFENIYLITKMIIRTYILMSLISRSRNLQPTEQSILYPCHHKRAGQEDRNYYKEIDSELRLIDKIALHEIGIDQRIEYITTEIHIER